MSRPSFFKIAMKNPKRGFTLIEILIAISLLSIMLSSIYGIFSAVSTTKERLDRDSTEYHQARVVFDRLGRELHGFYYRQKDPATIFRGGINQKGESYLELTTTATTPVSAVGTGIADVRYQLSQDQETNLDQQVLLRSERPRQSSKPATNSHKMRLAPDIASFSLRFFNQGQWREQWDARQDGLPQLVEIALLVGHDKERQIPFTTAFELPDIDTK